MSGIPRTTGAPDKLVTEQLPGGGVHTFGTSQSGFTHPRFPHIKFTHVSSLSGLNVSGDKQVIANHTGSEIISSTARSRIDSGSSVSSSSSSSQSSPSSEKSGFHTTTYSSRVPSTDTTVKGAQMSKTSTQSGSSSGYSSGSYLNLSPRESMTSIRLVSKIWAQSGSSSGYPSVPSLDLTPSSRSSPATSIRYASKLFAFDVMEHGGGEIMSEKEVLRVVYQGPGEIEFLRNGLRYEFKTTTYRRYDVYEGLEENQLKMVGPNGTINFIKPV